MSKPKKTTTKKAAKAKKPGKPAVDAKGHASSVEETAAAEKPAKAKKEKAPKEDLKVFAFRLTKEESEAIHKAAGPGKASKFVRSLAVAAANNDEAEVKAILKAVHAAA